MQPGARRRQLDETLRTAYSEGLLSESTFMMRLDQVLGEATIDPRRLVERLLVGRAPESDIVLDDCAVSRRHAELLWRGGTWVIHDIGSKNGTVLNGRTIERAQLRPGDYVSFAKRTFRVD
jgi:predicted component of type VI protein secretion system